MFKIEDIAVEEFFLLMKQTGQFDDLELVIIRAMLSLENKYRLPGGEFQFTANQIAKEAGLSVTNAYKYLYSLQRKGFIESIEKKNKIFWLTRSVNPFPRITSYVTKDYLNKKRILSKLNEVYNKIYKTGDSIWFGHKVYEEYSNDFNDRAAFLLDIAKEEILITTQRFFDDVLLLDAIKRAIERGVKMRIVTQEVHADLIDNFSKLGIDVKLGRAWPYVILVDGRHGITSEGKKGTWFLNCSTHFKDKFEELWERAESI